MIDVRESMRPVPALFQPLLTWITGKPLIGQKPIFRSTTLTQTTSALVSLFGGAAYGFWAIQHGPIWSWVGIPIAWLFVAGAARKIQVTLVHQCSHFNFTGNRIADRLAAQTLSTLVLTDHFDSYFREHIRIHHTKHLSSSEDPDCAFLLKLGFRPGMSESELWKNLWRTIFSPGFHFGFLRSRLRSNFVSAPTGRRIAAIAYHSAWIAGVASTGSALAYGLAWWFPLTFVYHIAALLNFSSLHVWLKAETPGDSAKERLCELTLGRFLGEAAPPVSAKGWEKIRLWSRWTFRMGFVHLPIRIGVLSGDLPVHDYHHRYPRCADWANFIYMRQRDAEAGNPGWEIPYGENWGIRNAIGAVYENLSRLPRSLSFAEELEEKEELSAAIAQI